MIKFDVLKIVASAAACTLIFVCEGSAQICSYCTRSFEFTQTQSAQTVHTGVQFQYIYRSDAVNGDPFVRESTVANPKDEKVADTVLNAYAKYDIFERFSLEFNVPIISRAFTRILPTEKESGRNTGLGDLSTLGIFNILSPSANTDHLTWSIRGGVKLPTGDTDELGAESDSKIINSGTRVRGRDMTLGSGSFDFPLGTSLSYDDGHLFWFTDVGYLVKLEGDDSYQFGNELSATLGAAFLAAKGPKGDLKLGGVVRFNNREEDAIDGDTIANSGNSVLSVGPSAEVALGRSFIGHIDAGIPIFRDANGAQLLPDYQLNVSAVAFF